MRNLYIIIDVQNDFIDGAFKNDEARIALGNIVRYISEAEEFSNPESNSKIILTRDLHDEKYFETQEGRNLPIEHCQKGTWGAEINSDLLGALQGKDYEIIDKGSFATPDLLKSVESYEPDQVIFMGICTDICVIANALLLKAHFPELPIYVKSACMAGLTSDKHKSALDVMSSCQIYDLDEKKQAEGNR